MEEQLIQQAINFISRIDIPDTLVTIAACLGAGLGLYNFYKDRAHLELNISFGLKLKYDDAKYLIITVSNTGRRPIFVKDIFLEYSGNEKIDICFHDILRLTDRDNPVEYYIKEDVLLEHFDENTIDEIKFKLKAVAIDCEGRKYYAREQSNKYEAYRNVREKPIPFNNKGVS